MISCCIIGPLTEPNPYDANRIMNGDILTGRYEMKKEFDIDQVCDAYSKLRPKYEQFTRVLTTLTRSLLDSHSIPVENIESRTKDLSSFREKLSRKGDSYSDPFNDVTDLVGIRIITFDMQSAEEIGKIIEAEFTVDSANSIDKVTELKANEVGYLSRHLIVRLHENRRDLQEYVEYRDLVAEIQIRTVLQHAWSAIDHKLRYKKPSDIPTTLLRRLYRLSGLLELADDEFSRIISEEDRIRRESVETKEDDTDQIAINLISLTVFMQRFDIIIQVKSAAEEAGFSVDEEDLRYVSDSASLLLDLNISTYGELRRTLTAFLPNGEQFYRRLAARYYEDGPPENPLSICVLFDYAVLAVKSSDVTAQILDTAGYGGDQLLQALRESVKGLKWSS